MRVRRLDTAGDMTFGQGLGNFWINQPEGVAQCVLTRLRLSRGEWFYDTTKGTPWSTEVLGERTQPTRDIVVRERVRSTVGVTEITRYGSRVDSITRTWTAAMTINTAYGAAVLAASKLPGEVPVLPPSPGAMARLLGVTGANDAPVSMVRADLTTGPQSDVTDFVIQRLDPGRF
jgi:hypothetical protein